MYNRFDDSGMAVIHIVMHEEKLANYETRIAKSSPLYVDEENVSAF